MKKRTGVLAISYCLAAVLVMGGFTCRALRREAASRRYVEAGWRRSFAALASDLTQMDNALQKCLCSASAAMRGTACAEVSAMAREAQLNMGELPFSDQLLEKTAGFLGRLGDYTRVMAQSAYRGTMSEAELEALQNFSGTTGSLRESLTQLQTELDAGRLSIGELAHREAALSAQMPSLGENMAELEDQFPELPTLIYDGPYSHSVEQGEAKYLLGRPEITETEALQAAADFTGLPKSAFQVLGLAQGKLPCYLLAAADLTLRVTVQGGEVLDLLSSGESLDETLPVEDALRLAEQFLRERGFENLKESYWQKEDGMLLINYAPMQEDVLCYPDLIKLRLSLDTGRVMGYDAGGYLLNHHERELPEYISREEAASAVSPALTLLSEGRVLIPTEGKQERFCWELKCETSDGSHCLLYVDAQTGEEAKVLLLLEDENGTLTI